MIPLVSAIIPTYNRADLLARALDSIIAQDHRPLEAVVIDDGSTDHTAEIIAAYEPRLADQQIQLIFHQQSNGRAPRARNVGMKLATGSLYAFLDSDDLWLPRFVSTLLRLLEQYPTAGLAFCGMLIIDANDHPWRIRPTGLPPEPSQGLLTRPFEPILRHMPLQTSGVMVRRSVIDDLGDFDLNLPVVEDWDLWYRIAKKYDFAYTLENLACNRSHPDNLPKYDHIALGSSLQMNLKHLPDVRDLETREMLIERIHIQSTLLQEELLRRGHYPNGSSHLLQHDLAPQTPRYLLGSMISAAPPWLGRSYAWMVRILGEIARNTQ
jgi:glycosyltransferase involved in cell wall biosynthesis